MNETTTKSEVITEAHVVAINAARDALHEISVAANNAAWDAPNSLSLPRGRPYAHWYGAVEALADTANDMLFNVLNRAVSTGVATISDELLFNHVEDEREPDGQRMEGVRLVPTDR